MDSNTVQITISDSHADQFHSFLWVTCGTYTLQELFTMARLETLHHVFGHDEGNSNLLWLLGVQ